MRPILSSLLAAALAAVILAPTVSADAAVEQGAYAWAAWRTGPFEFGGHSDAHRQVSMILSDGRVRGSDGAPGMRCYYYSNVVYLPDPSGAGGTELRLTSSVGCTPDLHFSASLDAATFPSMTIPTWTWTWTDGVISQPVPGTVTLAFEMMAVGRLRPFRQVSCVDETSPCANTITRVRSAEAEGSIDGVSLGPSSDAAIGWGMAVWH